MKFHVWRQNNGVKYAIPVARLGPLTRPAHRLRAHPKLYTDRRTDPEFLAKKEAEREPKTYAWYRESLTQISTFLEGRGLLAVGDFDEHAVNLFHLALRRKGLAENTISNRLRAIKAFARWMAERGRTDGNVLQHLRAPQTTKPDFDLIEEEARPKLCGLFSPTTFPGPRATLYSVLPSFLKVEDGCADKGSGAFAQQSGSGVHDYPARGGAASRRTAPELFWLDQLSAFAAMKRRF